MRSDPCVLQVYDEFAGSGLELLREAVHRKNVLLCGMSLIDRAETFGEIREIYGQGHVLREDADPAARGAVLLHAGTASALHAGDVPREDADPGGGQDRRGSPGI